MKTKTFIISIIIFTFTFQKCLSQSTGSKAKVSIAKLITKNNEIVKGILYDVNDSSVSLYTENKTSLKEFLLRDSLSLKNYSYRNIEIIKVRKRSAVAGGAILGGSLGLIAGIALDASEQNDLQAASNFAASLTFTEPDQIGFTPVFTITLGLIGTVSGALIGSCKKKINVHERNQLPEEERNKLMKFSLIKN